MTYEDQIRAELELAEAARLNGLEGRARVCARRAAGIAVRAYLARQEVRFPTLSSIDLLARFQQQPGHPAEVQTILAHLLERVNTEYSLPADIDLIEETRRLANLLGFSVHGEEDGRNPR